MTDTKLQIFVGDSWPALKEKLHGQLFKRIKLATADDLANLSNAWQGNRLFADASDQQLWVVELTNSDLAEGLKQLLGCPTNQSMVWVLVPTISAKVFSQFDTQVIQLPQSVKEVSDWMIKAIADLKGEIDTQALAWLTNQLALVKVMTWETLGIVSHSLKNMLDYASDRRITLDVAKSFLPELGEEDNISLLKTISKGDARQIFSTYQQLTKTKTADEIVPLLANQIVSLLLVKELGNEALVAKQTGWQFGRVRAVMYEAKNYSKTQLENLLTQLLILDTQIKTSVGEKNVILTGWLTNLIRR